MEDEDGEWEEALTAEQKILSRADKAKAPGICGCEFVEGTTTKEQNEDNIKWCHALVMDVDDWEHREPFTLEEIIERLNGMRFIAWTTWSSLPIKKKWRVVVPLASPMPPNRYRPLFRRVNEMLENTVSNSLADPGRLGFFNAASCQETLDQYQWHINNGATLDWTHVPGLEIEELGRNRKATDGATDFKVSADATSEVMAFPQALRYHRKACFEADVGERHKYLFKIACALWWDWAFTRENVSLILHEINKDLVVPKEPDEIESEVDAAWKRVLGPNRYEQLDRYGWQREPEMRASKESIADVARGLRRSTNDEKRTVGRALLAMSSGERIAEPQEATLLVPKALDELARHYPREVPERLLTLVQSSLEIQRQTSNSYEILSDKQALERIKHVQDVTKKKQEDRATKKADRSKMLLAQAFGGEREAPYSAKEYKEWTERGFESNQWIVQHSKSFYFFVGGSYKGPFSKETAQNFAHMLLAPAADRVETTTIRHKDGAVLRKPLDELVQEYGSFAMKAELVMGAERSYYNMRTQEIFQNGTLPDSSILPRFHPEVDTWLRHLALGKYELLKQWLAASTYLDRPLVALALATKRASGKNLLALGLAKLWGHQPVSLHEYRSEALEMCPVVWCDERVPARMEKSFGAFIKRIVSEEYREVKRPYVDVYRLTGYVRLLFTANSMDDMHLFKEDMGADSLEALRERLLYIDTTQDPRANDASTYLKSIGLKHREFVEKNLIAEHVLWLRENLELNFNNRFIVVDKHDAKTEALSVVGQATTSRLYDWITIALTTTRVVNKALLVKDSKIYINGPLMHSNWDQMDNSGTFLSLNEISRNLAKIAPERKLITINGRRTQYRILDEDMYLTWLEAAEIEPDEILDNLKKIEATNTFTVG